jgi:hypothetical protein
VIVADQSAVNHPRIILKAGLAAVVNDDQMFNGIVNGLQASFKQVIPVQDGDDDDRHHWCSSFMIGFQ